MTLIIVLMFFKSLCLCIQNIVLACYDKFLNPKPKYYTGGGASSGSSYQRNRSGHSSTLSAQHKSFAREREQLLEKIRSRKRAAKLQT